MDRKWKPVSRDPAEFGRQFAAGVQAGRAAAAEEPRAVSAEFDAATRSVRVELRDGVSFSFPVARFPVLAALSERALAAVRATASGYGLHWDDADVHLAVPTIVADLFGRLAAQHSGRAGGKSRSPAKVQAARRNARRGGRPAIHTEARPSAAGMRVETRSGRSHRSVEIHEGGEYVVEPLNPAARKNRGRTGQVLGFEGAKDGRVRFRFHDTGRVALIEPGELLPVEAERSAAD